MRVGLGIIVGTTIALISSIADAQSDPLGAPPKLIDWSLISDPHAIAAVPLNANANAFAPPESLERRQADVASSAALIPSVTIDPRSPVQRIPVAAPLADGMATQIVRYDVPLKDRESHEVFAQNGLKGRLVELAKDPSSNDGSVRIVRYEVPSDNILLHSDFDERGIQGELVEVSDGRSWKPEVRFLQPKARVFFDLKRDNDEQFDLFRDGSFLASLDLLEIYQPLKFITDYFAEEKGNRAPLDALGWRFGATLGFGITTALSDGVGSGAPIGVASLGVRYEFPIGPTPPTVLDQQGRRIVLDQRTRVGFSTGIQVGTSTDETITDRYDAGFYLGMLVNTPW